jgi:hypothetical protein
MADTVDTPIVVKRTTRSGTGIFGMFVFRPSVSLEKDSLR